MNDASNRKTAAARPFCLGLSKTWGEPAETLRLMAETGWNGFFPVWTPGEDLRPLARLGADSGLFMQSVHAPWGKAADLWGEDEEKGRAAVRELSGCMAAAADASSPLVVAHAWIGFKPTEPSARGLERFAEVLGRARALGVRFALENTEGEEHLDALMEAFRDEPLLGFCWDTGHELCYNRSRDMMADYGPRLFATHLDDNLGITDPSGPTTWHDDLHLLPFDGVADWPGIARRLAASRFGGPLTFELNRASKPGRHENDAYGAMPLRDYLALAMERAVRFAGLLPGA